MPPYLLATAGLAIVALAFASFRGEGAEAGATVTVFVNNNRFCGSADSDCTQPYEIQIDPGSTVEWIDGQSGGVHTVTQCTGDGTGCPMPGGFDSGVLSDPAVPYLSESFSSEGTFYFRCQIHGNSMRGIITVGSVATPAPTLSPTPSPSPTPGQTTSPTPTATAMPTPSPTSTPTLSGRSDVNCDGETDGDDVLALLFHTADAPQAASPQGVAGCAPIGTDQEDGPKGDLNCDGVVDGGDALAALLVWAGVPVTGLPAGCPGP